MYYGEAQTALDDKGRLTVPMQFRSVMEVHDHDVWYMTRGFDGAIFLFEKEQWQALEQKSSGHSPLDPQRLDFRRLFLGSVAKSKRDKQGRLAIASHLREYAGISKEAVLIGVEDHLELWSKAGWLAFQASQAEQYKAMAAELFGAKKVEAVTNEGAV